MNRWVALLGVTAVTVYLSWKVLEPFVSVLILGIALTVIFQPVHRQFVRWTGGIRRGAAASTLFTLLVLVIPFTFVSITVVKEVPGAIREVDAGWKDLQQHWNESSESGSWLGSIREKLQLEEDPFAPDQVKEYVADLKGLLKRNFLPVVGGVVGFLLGCVFLVFVLFFLFRDGEKLGAKLIDFLPLPRDQALVLVRRTEEVLGACVYGVLMVAAVQGTLGGITFAALGLPSPVTWGLVMTLLCTLPIVGAWLVWLPAAAYLAIHGDYTRAIILALVGQFVISSIDGLLRPILVGQKAKLHELVIFFCRPRRLEILRPPWNPARSYRHVSRLRPCQRALAGAGGIREGRSRANPGRGHLISTNHRTPCTTAAILSAPPPDSAPPPYP